MRSNLLVHKTKLYAFRLYETLTTPNAMNRSFQCYLSVMTAASVTGLSVCPATIGWRNVGRYHPSMIRPYSVVNRVGNVDGLVRSNGGVFRDRYGYVTSMSTRHKGSLSEEEDGTGNTVAEEDTGDNGNKGHSDDDGSNNYATSYHAPVMLNECIDALLQRSHNKSQKKQKYKSKAAENAALLGESAPPPSPGSISFSTDSHNGGDGRVSERPRVFIDGTLGGGGHSHYLLTQLSDNDVVIGCDVDPSALATASDRLKTYIVQHNTTNTHKGPVFIPVQSNFKDMATVVYDLMHPVTGEPLVSRRRSSDTDDGVDEHDNGSDSFTGVDGVLLDLGVSSHQIDNKDRGFAFMKDGPLDMRMGNGSWQNHNQPSSYSSSSPLTTNTTPPSSPITTTNNTLNGLTAADICNEFTEQDLISIFQTHANESRSKARRLAQAIIAARPLSTTHHLVDAIATVTPEFCKKSRRGGRSATCARIFSSLRIVVNEEDRVLEEALEEMAPKVVGKGGRLVVLSYHSLEDRAVKRVMRDGSVGNKKVQAIERDLYGNEIVDGEVRPWKTLGKRMKASEEEIERNRRARSATLRVAERL